jgi:hypothetical protein
MSLIRRCPWLVLPVVLTGCHSGEPESQKQARAQAELFLNSSRTTTTEPTAVAKAVLAANTATACDACKPVKPEERCAACKTAAIPHWHPHQIRHTHATEVRRRFGIGFCNRRG